MVDFPMKLSISMYDVDIMKRPELFTTLCCKSCGCAMFNRPSFSNGAVFLICSHCGTSDTVYRLLNRAFNDDYSY